MAGETQYVSERFPEVPTQAWLHQCGHLNAGEFGAGDYGNSCGGCRFDVEQKHADRGDVLLLNLSLR